MAHTIAQPGLHAHSWDPDTDLMKQFVVQRSLGEGKGWLSLASFHALFEAVGNEWDREAADIVNRTYQHRAYRIWDQFNNRKV